MKEPKTLLTFAGHDPSGGAGAGLDLRVFERLGFRGAAVLTSVTAQDAARVRRVHHLPPALVRSQYEALVGEVAPAGIKVGMAGSLDNLRMVARILGRHPDIPKVVDTVFASSSGAALLEKRAVASFLQVMRGAASLLTPNLGEASVLTGRSVKTVEDMKESARSIGESGGIPCLVKGGHLAGAAVDVLWDGRDLHIFGHARVNADVHGTGCFLSAAILAYLATGCLLPQACRRAIALTVRTIRRSVPAGGGRRVFPDPL
jgi:hydroxymethylpyrimidine/phosphomethylpyrimidine kinase